METGWCYILRNEKSDKAAWSESSTRNVLSLPCSALCSVCVFVYFLMENRRLMDEIKKRDV